MRCDKRDCHMRLDRDFASDRAKRECSVEDQIYAGKSCCIWMIVEEMKHYGAIRTMHAAKLPNDHLGSRRNGIPTEVIPIGMPFCALRGVFEHGGKTTQSEGIRQP